MTPLSIGNKGFRISFLREHPGREAELADRLERWCQLHDVPWNKTNTALGSIDRNVFTDLEVGADVEGRNVVQRLDPSRAGFVWNALYCYGFDGLADSTRVDKVLAEPVLLVSMFKISDSVVAALGWRAEEELARHVSAMARGAVHCVLGSLGWHELVFIQASKAVGEMIEELLAIRKATLADNPALSAALETLPGDTPLFETSFSVLAVSDVFAARARSLERAESNSPELIARISAVGRPGRIGTIAERFREVFGKTVERRAPLGSGEVVASVNVPLEILVRDLLRFHETCGDSLRRTETAIEMPLDAVDGKGPATSHRVEVEVPSLKDLRREDRHSYSVITQLLSAYNYLMSEECDSDSYRDQAKYLQTLLSMVSRAASERPSTAVIAGACSRFEFGLNQRYVGSFSSWADPDTPIRARFDGGIHRVTAAVDAIVNEATRSFGVEWTGFSVFGYRDEPFRLDLGIMNLPWTSLLHPEDWSVLFHEAGHELAAVLDNSLIQGPLRSMWLGLTSVPFADMSLAELETVRAHLLYVWELAADLAEYTLYAGGNWTNHLRSVVSVWTQLPHAHTEERVAQQLDRLLLVKSLHFSDDELNNMSEPARFKAQWQRLCDEIEALQDIGFGEVGGIAAAKEGEAPILGYTRYHRWRPFYAVLHNEVAAAFRTPPQEASPKEDYSELLSGRPMLPQTAAGLVRWASEKSRTGEVAEFSERMAVVLSLWWKARLELGGRPQVEVVVPQEPGW